MKNYFVINALLSIVCLSCLYSCSESRETQVSTPQVKYGVAKVSGTVKYWSEDNEEKTYTISVVNPITIKEEEIEIIVDKDGRFQADIPIEVSPTIAYFKTNRTDQISSFLVTSEKKTKVDIFYDKNNDLISPVFFENQRNWGSLTEELIDYSYAFDLNRDEVIGFINDPVSYVSFIIDTDLHPKLKSIEKNNNISQTDKEYLSNVTRIFVAQHFLSYHSKMKFYFGLTEEKGDITRYIPNDLDISYYVFLKGFDLNNPQYLIQTYYPQVLQDILTDKTMQIPKIGDTPINQWLDGIREKMTNLTGFDKGLFYDILIGNAYALQFINEMKPLSDIQIKNIKEYFKGGEIEKILLRKNKEIIPLEKLWTPAVANETPTVAKEKLMETIVYKYRGKAVVVDFWATWCVPCLKGIKDTKLLKLGMKDKDIVFVYITTESSPWEAWKVKIEEIGGEHYYLETDEWAYILQSFDFKGIPTYQLYDRNGNLQEQITACLDANAMQKKIEQLLKK